MATDSAGDIWFDVRARESATSDDLVALGKVLKTWQAQAGKVSILGLEELLQGRYPAPCEPFPMTPNSEGDIDLGERGRFSIPTPWLYCYARVTSRTPVMSEKELWRRLELRRKLEDALPADVGHVTNPDSGHW